METFSLLGIQDVEAFCARIVDRSEPELRFHDREDLLAYLIETAWSLSLSFEPERSTVTFSTFAGTILRRRITDWRRTKFRTKWQFKDRVYERPRPVFVPLEDDSLRASFAAWDGGDAADHDEGYLGRLNADRDRLRTRDLAAMGVAANRGTTRRNRAPELEAHLVDVVGPDGRIATYQLHGLLVAETADRDVFLASDGRIVSWNHSELALVVDGAKVEPPKRHIASG